MLKRQLIMFFCLLVLCSVFIKANTDKTDSLKLSYLQERSDTVKLNILISIADEYRNNNNDSSLKYYEKAEILAQIALKEAKGSKTSLFINQKLIAIYSGIGSTHRLRGSNSLALEYYRNSMEIAEEINDLQGVASAKYNTGVVYYNQGKQQLAMENYEKALLLQEEIEYSHGLAITINAIGAIYLQQGNQDKAVEYFTKSLELNEEVGNTSGVATLLNNIGQIHDNQGNTSKALEHYYKSIQIREEIGDKIGIAGTLNNIGNVYRSQGDITKSLEYFIESLKIREEVGDRSGVAVSLNNVGNIYRMQDEHEKALEYYQKSMDIYKEINNISGIASSLNNMGVVYRIKATEEKNKGNISLSDSLFKVAVDNYNKSYELRERIGERRTMAISLNNIGAIYLERANGAKSEGRENLSRDLYIKALEYYKSSYDLCVETGNRQGMSFTLSNIARVYINLGQLAKARKYAIEAYQISHSLGFPDNILRASQLLKEVYLQRKDFEKAYKYFAEEVLMRDSLNNEATFRETMKQQARYEFEKKALADSIRMAEERNISKATIMAKEEQLKREAFQRYALYGSLVVMLVFGLIVYYHYRQKRDANILLAAQNIDINQKNEEITSQRDEIESQRDLVVKQKVFIEEQNTAITGSINYAKRIQQALLPDLSVLFDSCEGEYKITDSFIFYRPKEIVSGDFYWANLIDNHLVIAVADCTGHGVPGGFMSMLGVSFLNEIVNKNENLIANEILNDLRERVVSTLKQAGRKDEDDNPILDGINIIIAVIDLNTQKMQYAGSYNPLYMIRNNELNILKTDKKTIGVFVKKFDSFTNFEIDLKKGDMFYMFSDGFIDQFDAKSNERFKYSRFKQLLASIHDKPLAEQNNIVEKTFENWKGSSDQIDDVTILGFRI